MGLTSGFVLLGGVGTTCVALFPTNWDSMTALAPFQWLYILFVLAGIALGILGIRATIRLIQGADKSYRDALFVLVSSVIVGIIHIIVSRELRGKSMPVDAVVYMTILTLMVFLIFRIPNIWQGVNFTRQKDKPNKLAGGLASILLGLFALTIQYMMGPTHTWDGVNYADAFNTAMTLVGTGFLLTGVWMLPQTKLIFLGIPVHAPDLIKKLLRWLPS